MGRWRRRARAERGAAGGADQGRGPTSRSEHETANWVLTVLSAQP